MHHHLVFPVQAGDMNTKWLIRTRKVACKRTNELTGNRGIDARTDGRTKGGWHGRSFAIDGRHGRTDGGTDERHRRTQGGQHEQPAQTVGTDGRAGRRNDEQNTHRRTDEALTDKLMHGRADKGTDDRVGGRKDARTKGGRRTVRTEGRHGQADVRMDGRPARAMGTNGRYEEGGRGKFRRKRAL